MIAWHHPKIKSLKAKAILNPWNKKKKYKGVIYFFKGKEDIVGSDISVQKIILVVDMITILDIFYICIDL